MSDTEVTSGHNVLRQGVAVTHGSDIPAIGEKLLLESEGGTLNLPLHQDQHASNRS